MSKTKYIESPEQLEEYFENYKKWVLENPFRIQEYVGQQAKEVKREKARPLTFEGFESWLRREGVINDLGDYSRNKGGSYDSYSTIIKGIRKEIRACQIEGAMSGLFNANLVSRYNNLGEKIENQNFYNEPIEVKIVADFGLPLASREEDVRMD